MKKNFLTVAVLAFSLMATQSCNKAGTDGEATLVVFPQHHGATIANQPGYPDSVYVTFNTQDLPADPTHHYDAVFVGETGEDHVHCTTLHTGKYYLFVTGWDTSLNARVSGGMAIKIKHSEKKKEIDTKVPVTE